MGSGPKLKGVEKGVTYRTNEERQSCPKKLNSAAYVAHMQGSTSNFWKALGVNSIDINFGLKIGPRCGIEKSQTGRSGGGLPLPLGRTGPSFGPKTGPRFFMSIELTPCT